MIRLLPIFILTIVIVGGFLFLKSRNGVVKVSVEQVETRNISKTISSSGKTDVREGNTTRALVGGVIKEIKFKSGDAVKKGDLIIVLDQASLKAALDTAYSTYLSAKADLDSYDQKIEAAKALKSQRLRERDQAWREYMANNGETNKQLYKTAEYNHQSAISSLETLENAKKAVKNSAGSTYSSYVSALNNYRNTSITSPADGQLALREIFQGSLLTAGQALFSITSSESIIFKAEIDEADVSHVKPGMNAKVSLDSYPGETFEAKVESIDAKIETLTSGSTVVMANISFKNSSVLPILGLNGSADIEFDKSQNTLSVSIDSIFEESNKKYVFTIIDGVTVKKEVQTGFEGDGYIGIVSGLNNGMVVVSNVSSYVLKDKQVVKAL